jgi:hypothetical protein
MATHETVEISVGSMSAKVDVEIAAIVKMLWILGVVTRYSCQDHEVARNPKRPDEPVMQLFIDDLKYFRLFLDLLSATEAAERLSLSTWRYRVTVLDSTFEGPSGMHGAFCTPVEVAIPVCDRELLERSLESLIN